MTGIENYIHLTLGVCPLTFPARARDPWTLPVGSQNYINAIRIFRQLYICGGTNLCMFGPQRFVSEHAQNSQSALKLMVTFSGDKLNLVPK